MATGTYGEPGKNPYAIPGVGGILSNVVNAQTGVSQVYRQGALGQYQSLGTYNSSTGKFTPAGNLTTAETQALSSQNGITNIRNASVTTAQRAGLDSQKSKQLIFPNTGAAGDSGAADGTAPVDLKIEGTGKKEGFGNHSYPLDLGKSKQDKIKFNMLRYAPRGFQSFSRGGENLGALTNRESTNKRILGSVILPVPSGISETNSCGWGEQPATPFELLAQNIALTSIQKGFGSGADVLGGAVSAAASPENSQELKTAVTGLIAQNAAGAGGLLSRTQGAVINPNLELLFTGPALRPFSFTFKMSARSETEAKEIIKIIRFFKQGMSPQKSSSNLFIKAPHTFEIRYILGSSKDKNHPFIGQIKECALQSFNVNYTPEGQYATFHDGPMISYEIQMQFTELEPVFNEDYGTGGSDLPTNLLFENLKKS